eukprot:162770-Pyramimonas_sp.AAC.1
MCIRDRPAPPSGSNADEIKEGPGQPKEVKSGGRKHSVKKHLVLKQTKQDNAHDDRAQLQVPVSIQRHMEVRKMAEETAAAPTATSEGQQGTTP